MAKALSVKLKIDADGNVSGVVNGIKNDLKKMGGQVDKVSDSTDRLTSSLKHVGHYGLAAFAGWGLSNIVGDVVNATKEMQSLQASLITVKGSAIEADKAFSQIQKFAKTTPYQLTEVTDAFIKMEALGLTASERAMRSYGDTASSMGKSLNQMVEAVADAATGEFERLKEFGIKASSEGDKVTFTFKGVATEVGKNAAEIEAYLMQLGEVNFAGGMKLQMETLGGQLSNLEDNWAQTLNALGEASQPAISAAIGGLNDLADGIESAADYMDEAALLAGVGLTTALTAKAIPAIWATSTAFNAATASAGGFAAATRAATAAGLAFAATPLGLAVTAVAGTVAYLALREDEAEIATRDLTEALKENNVELSRGEFKKRAEQLKEYRQEYDALLTLKKQNAAIDILGLKEGDLQRKIERLMMGLDATVKLTKATEPLVDLEKEFKASVDDSTESLSQFSEMLSFIAQTENEWKNESSKEREAIQEKINELTLTEAQQRQLILNNLEPENRALQEKLFAIQDAQAAQAAADQAKQEAAEMAIDAVEAEIAAVYELSNAYLDAQENLRKNLLGDAFNSENAQWDAFEDADKLLEESLSMVNEYGDAWTQTGDKALDAIGSMVAALSDVNSNEIKYAEQVAKINEAKFEDEAGRVKALQAIEELRIKNSVKGSKDMLAASVAMFEEGSKAQKAAHTIYQTVTAVELGLELQKQIALMTTGTTAVAASTAAMTAKTGEAMANATASVTAAGSGDPYTAPLRVVAMTAMMAATLANIGQSFGGSDSGGMSMQEAAMGQLDIQEKILDFEDNAITNRLDQQIEILESIDRNGSVSALEVRSAPDQFERDFEQWRIDFLRDAQFGWWDSAAKDLTEFSAYIGRVNSMFDEQLYLLKDSGAQITINQAAIDTPEKLLNVVDKVLSGSLEYAFPLQSQMLEELHAKGASAQQMFDAMTSSIESSFTDLQQATTDWALTTIDAINDMTDASLSLQDAYDKLTRTTYYEDKRLADAYAEIDSLAAGRSYAQFIQDEIENIEKAQELLDEESISLLLSKNSEDFVAQTQLLNQITEQLGRTFANGAEGVLNYMDSIDLVVNDLVSSADEVVEATSGIAEAWRSLSGSFASYEQIMGTDEASLVAAQKADLQSAYQSEVDAINSVISSTNDSINSLKSLSSQLSSAFDSIYSKTVDMTLERYSAAQAELLQYAQNGIVPVGEELSRILGVVTQNSTSSYSSRADYLRDQALTANAISDLNDIVDGQLSTEEQTLSALQSQLDSSKISLDYQLEQIDLAQQQNNFFEALIDLTKDVAEYVSTGFSELDDSLDGILDFNEFSSAFAGLATEETLQAVYQALDINGDQFIDSLESRINALSGSDFTTDQIQNFIDSVMTEYGAYGANIVAGAALSTGTTSSQIAQATGVDEGVVTAQMYTSANYIDSTLQEMISSGASPASLYNFAKQMSVSASALASYLPAWSTQDVNEYVSSQGWEPLPAFASGGVHSGGLRLVGEQGPELEFTGPSRIVSNNDTLKMLDNSRLEKLVEKLIDRVEQLEEQAARSAVATENSASLLVNLKQGVPTYDMRTVNA